MTQEDKPEDVAREDPTDPGAPKFDTLPPPRNGFRDENTAASESRTIKLEGPPSWQGLPQIELERPAPRDPMFWPVVVVVAVLVSAIGVMLLSSPKPHNNSGDFSAGH